MTREEEIEKAAIETRCAVATSVSGDNYTSIDCLPFIEGKLSYDELIENAFIKGAEWADKHPELHWIDVKDDLPYNHYQLMVTKYATVNVFVLRKGGSAGVNSMININGKWEWEDWRETYTHWMPIPSV